MRSSTNSYFNAVQKVRNPATTALESSGILHLPCDQDQDKSAASKLEQHHKGQMENKSSNCISYGSSTKMKSSFDLNELVEATRPIQESLGMPLIEWSFLSDDESSYSDKPEKVTTPEEPEDDTNNDDNGDSYSSEISTLLSCSSPLGKRNRFNRSRKNRLVRSKALNSHLSMLETSFLSLARGCKLDEPRSATDFPFSYDVERWIELAEHAAAKVAPVGLTSKQHQVQTSSQQQQQQSPPRCRHAAAVVA